MKSVIIICEGLTEKEFCMKTLSPHFSRKNIFIYFPLIKKSMGGIIKWAELRKQITLHLRNEPDKYVTTLIDYYGLHRNYGFPRWDEAEQIADKNARMELLELGMKENIDNSIRYRFIPYIQLHEFEGLLFNDLTVFQDQIPPKELIGLDELIKTLTKYNNPEMINREKETSPSHRLKRIISGYNKVVYGNILAEAIGLDRIRAKSPRFNNWIVSLENIQPLNPAISGSHSTQ